MRVAVSILVGITLACSAQAASWKRLTVPRADWNTSVYDPVRNRVVLLPTDEGVVPNEYWTLDIATPDHWIRRSWATPGPDPANVRGIAFDPRFDQFVVYARASGFPPRGPAPLGVWVAKEGGAWSELPSSGPNPGDRFSFSLAYDTSRKSFILFGGSNSDVYGGPDHKDFWRLDLGGEARWEPLTVSGDSIGQHTRSGAIYDAKRDRVVILGGVRSIERGGQQEPSSDILALNLSDLSLTHRESDYHTQQSDPRCVVDPTNDRILIFSYGSPPVGLSLADLSTWTSLGGTSALPTSVRLAASLPSGETGISCGSNHDVYSYSIPSFSGLDALGPGPDQPSAEMRIFASGPTFPRGRNSAVLYWSGFFSRSPESAYETWRFDPSSDPHWTRLQLSGLQPTPRTEAALAYDSRRHRWLMYGGVSGNQLFDDLWSFDPLNPGWTRIEAPPGDSPPAMSEVSAAYDSFRDRLLLFGGRQPGYKFSSETYALPLDLHSGWQRLGIKGPRPHGRGSAGAVCDPSSDRLYIFAGSWWTPPGATEAAQRALRDTWSLPLESEAAWDSIDAEPIGPFTRSEQFAWFDPTRSEILALGGNSPFGPLSTIGSFRAFSLEGQPGWHSVSDEPPVSRLASYLPESDRLYTFGFSNDLNQAWAFDRGRPAHLVALDLSPRGDGKAPQGSGLMTIAVLGDPLFDVRSLDVGSLVLGGARVLERGSDRSSIRDFNGDGISDRLVSFDSKQVELQPGDRVVRLDGQSVDGLEIIGFAPATSNRTNRTPILANGDPDAPIDTVRPLAVFASGFERGAGVLRIDLPARARVMVEVYAVNGRRVAGQDLGELDAGSHDVGNLGLSDAAAGIYFVRARAGNSTAQTRFISIP